MNSIAIVGTGSALANPKLFEQDAGLGQEEVREEDLAIPFFKLLQKMSPEMDLEDFEGKPGQILNTLTMQVHDEIFVLPVFYRHVYNEWRPRAEGGGLQHQYDADEGPKMLEKCKQNDKNIDILPGGNELYDTREHYVLMVDGNGVPVEGLIAMKRTQNKKSTRWNSLIRSIKVKGKKGLFNPPSFSHVYRLGSETESNADGDLYFNWNISNVGPLSSEHIGLYEIAKTFHHIILTKSRKIVTVDNVEGQDATKEGIDNDLDDDVPF